jgi:hypothetical protein
VTDEAIPPAILPAFSYLFQSRDPEKLKADRKKLAELADRHALRAVRYEDAPDDIHRPRLGLLLERARLREHGALLVLRLHDLAKTKPRIGRIFCDLYESDVRVIASSGIELSPKVARWLADEEITHRRKVKRALDRKREEGERTGEIPYGYGLHPDGVHLIEDSYEQSVVREAKWLAHEGYTAGQIAHVLARKGWTNRAGRPHERGAIRRWLERGW